MVCKRQEQCVFGEKCIYHIGSVLPKCSIFEQKPPIKQTEQEYLQTCDTEQLAEWIFRVREKCYYCGARQIPDREHCAFGDEFCRNNRHEFVEWLKQPHREVIDKWWERNEDKPC